MAEEEEYIESEIPEGGHELEIAHILADYRRRKFREHMIGPVISFVVHIVVLVLMSVLIVGKTYEEVPQIQVEIEEVEIKELEPPQIEEIEDVEEEVPEEAPEMQVDVPDVPTESVEAALEDVSEEAPETDDDFDMDEVLDVMPTTTPLKMAGIYGGRTEAGRKASVSRYGGTSRGQSAVLKALRWLKKVQRQDGSWEANPAFSGLALLCFLAHGETPLSEEFGITVQKAMQWEASKTPVRSGRTAYANGIATYAVSEAYGMTQIPFLKSAMEEGLAVIVKGQQPNGGFDYGYKQGVRWDLSVAGWQMQAMKAGFVAGANVDGLPEALDKAENFLRKVTFANGKFGYSSAGTGGNMTGVGTVCLQLLGFGDTAEARAGADTIFNTRLNDYTWDNAAGSLYGWYYDTQAMFHRGGGDWKTWNRKFQNELIRNQHEEGYWEIEHGGHGYGDSLAGRVYVTTLVVLQLEVYYRYLPTFDIRKMKHKVVEKSILDDDGGLIID